MILFYSKSVKKPSKDDQTKFSTSKILESINQINMKNVDVLLKVLDNFNFKDNSIFCTGVGASYVPALYFSHALASIGIRASAVEPTELLHGGLGRVRSDDLIFAFSNSGNTNEIKKIIKSLLSPEKVFLITGNDKNSAQDREKINKLIYSFNSGGEVVEGVPSSSILVQLICAIYLLNYIKKKTNLTINSKSHPAGDIGLLNMKVSQLMKKPVGLEIYRSDITLSRIAEILNSTNLGIVLIKLPNTDIGIFTDGDLRRVIVNNLQDIKTLFQEKIIKFVNKNPKLIQESSTILDALELFENGRKVLIIPVLKDKEIIGVLHVHDVIGVLSDS